MRAAPLLVALAVLPALAGPAGAGAAHHVAIVDLAYDPQALVVALGDQVTWTNRDGPEHTVTSLTLAFDSGHMEDGAAFTHVFDLPGAYPYFCLYHPLMQGLVVVAA